MSQPSNFAAVILGTVRIATVIAVAFFALVLLGLTIGLEPLAVPLLMLGYTAAVAFATGAIRLHRGDGDAP